MGIDPSVGESSACLSASGSNRSFQFKGHRDIPPTDRIGEARGIVDPPKPGVTAVPVTRSTPADRHTAEGEQVPPWIGLEPGRAEPNFDRPRRIPGRPKGGL